MGKGFCTKTSNEKKLRKSHKRALTAKQNLEAMGIEAEVTYDPTLGEMAVTVNGEGKARLLEKMDLNF